MAELGSVAGSLEGITPWGGRLRNEPIRTATVPVDLRIGAPFLRRACGTATVRVTAQPRRCDQT
jgi:hypothetical protein